MATKPFLGPKAQRPRSCCSGDGSDHQDRWLYRTTLEGRSKWMEATSEVVPGMETPRAALPFVSILLAEGELRAVKIEMVELATRS